MRQNLTMPDLTVISLGGGIQSTAMCLMVEAGLLEGSPDVALFADTGWEPAHVYETVSALEGLISFPVETVSRGRSLKEDVKAGVQANGLQFLPIPAFVRTSNGVGMGRRQCTNQYKLHPIEQAIRRRLGLQSGQQVKKGTIVHQWLGISLDESIRMKDNRKPYIINKFPLIEARLSRQDLRLWLNKHFPDVPVGKSACLGCPYKDNKTWLKTKELYPDDFAETIEIDKAIRNLKEGQQQFLHASGLPLEEAVKQTGQQETFFEMNECEGGCFL